jgi:hypothetical protein
MILGRVAGNVSHYTLLFLKWRGEHAEISIKTIAPNDSNGICSNFNHFYISQVGPR